MHRETITALDPAMLYAMETDDQGAFRWTRQSFRLAVPAGGARFATLHFASLIPHNQATIFAGGRSIEVELLEGWQHLSVDLNGGTEVDFRLVAAFRAVGDTRQPDPVWSI